MREIFLVPVARADIDAELAIEESVRDGTIDRVDVAFLAEIIEAVIAIERGIKPVKIESRRGHDIDRAANRLAIKIRRGDLEHLDPVQRGRRKHVERRSAT